MIKYYAAKIMNYCSLLTTIAIFMDESFLRDVRIEIIDTV